MRPCSTCSGAPASGGSSTQRATHRGHRLWHHHGEHRRCRAGRHSSLHELVLVKGSRDDLLSLMDGLRPVSGVREVNSALTNGWAQSKLKH
jgi:hypothetical protein